MFIRNIIATAGGFDGRVIFSVIPSMGAFSLSHGNTGYRVGFETGDYPTKGFTRLNLDANSGDTNPTAGHASDTIKPFTILAMPIYVF